VGVAAREAILHVPGRWVSRRSLALAALFAQLAVLAVGIAVQRDFIRSAWLPDIVGLWGKVALVGAVVWIAAWPFADHGPLAKPVVAAKLTRPRRWLGGALLAGGLILVALGLGDLAGDLASSLGGWLWLLGS